jgi:hypothetical protein
MSISSELASALISAASLLFVAFVVTNKTILKWVDGLSKPKGQ